MFNVTNLASGYGQSEVIHDLNFAVGKQEIVAVMGRNGMGKTTLFKTLMGILPTRGGSVTIERTWRAMTAWPAALLMCPRAE
jgi:urea transport system ATP-binding protein